MALKVVWAATAQSERASILRFYRARNGNPRYSQELSQHFNTAMGLVAEQELMGKPTELPQVRCLFVLSIWGQSARS